MLQALLDNQVFSGMVGGSLVASLLYALREVPTQLYRAALWRFTSHLVVHNDDAAFERLSEWLAELEYTKRARRLRLTTSYIEEGESSLLFTPGVGRHLIRHKRQFFVMERTEQDSEMGLFRRESFVISCLGGPAPIRRLVDEARAVQAASHVTPVFLFRGYWRRIASKRRRTLESVVLPPEQKQRILKDVRGFLGARAWYEARSLPYRRNYQFYGPPGTGKTSFAAALAGELGRPLYALNLGSLGSDDALFEAVLNVPADGVLLIEDIDAASATKTRDAPLAPVLDKPGEPKAPERTTTLSGLLNALDGAFSRDGRIVITTTNHPDKLDPALLRKGRADLRECFDWFAQPEAEELAWRFGVTPGKLLAIPGLEFPVAPADLQETLKRLTAVSGQHD